MPSTRKTCRVISRLENASIHNKTENTNGALPTNYLLLRLEELVKLVFLLYFPSSLRDLIGLLYFKNHTSATHINDFIQLQTAVLWYLIVNEWAMKRILNCNMHELL